MRRVGFAGLAEGLTTVCLCCVAIAALSQIGCERSSSKAPAVPALPPNDTPEGKLARVMQRLESALDTAQAASGSGVVSERRAYHKYFPATADSDQPTATIYLETRVALAPRTLNDAAQAKLLAEAEKNGEEAPTEGKPLVFSDEEKVEVEEFDLVFEGDRWRLTEEIKAESEDAPPSTEQILFEYALGAN